MGFAAEKIFRPNLENHRPLCGKLQCGDLRPTVVRGPASALCPLKGVAVLESGPPGWSGSWACLHSQPRSIRLGPFLKGEAVFGQRPFKQHSRGFLINGQERTWKAPLHGDSVLGSSLLPGFLSFRSVRPQEPLIWGSLRVKSVIDARSICSLLKSQFGGKFAFFWSPAQSLTPPSPAPHTL